MTRFDLSGLSVKGKVLAIVMLTTTVALLSAGAAFTAYHLQSLSRAMRRDAAVSASVIAANSAAALLFNDARSAAETLSSLRLRPRYEAGALYDGKGRVFADYAADGGVVRRPERPGPDGARAEGGRLVVFAPVVSGRERVGTVFLALSLRDFNASAAFFLGLSAFIILLCSAAAYAVGSRLQAIVSQPILDLADTARAITAGRDYSLRAAKSGQDELGLLADAFNEMLSVVQGRDASLEKARVELELRVKERTQELESFTYSVSHDLRAPLRSIDGFGAILEKDCAGQLDETGLDSLRRIRAGARRMGALIDGLLRLAHLGRTELRSEDVDLSALAGAVAERLRQGEPGRRTRFVIAPGLRARCDAGLLEAALENLLGNAWKFTSGKAEATITFSSSQDGGRTIYSVTDDGAGFDPAHSGKLFGAFQRLHSQAEFPGVGVGLATARRIIERHGGRIWADGRLGRGAEFHFTLGEK